MGIKSANIAILLCTIFYFLSTPIQANGLSVSPSYQYLTVSSTASTSAKQQINGYTPYADPSKVSISPAGIIYKNNSTTTVTLNLSLAHIQATDLMGRLQFNAPLPQSIIPATSELATITPLKISLEPNQTATASVTFNPLKIEPGKTAYIVLADVETPNVPPNTNNEQIKHVIGSSIVIKDPVNALANLELKKFDWSSLPILVSLPDIITLSIKNSGSGPGTPRGIIEVTDNFKRSLARGAINHNSTIILPKSERLITNSLYLVESAYPVSLATLKITGYDELKQSQFSATKTFILVNPISFLVAILILISIPLIIKLIPKRHV